MVAIVDVAGVRVRPDLTGFRQELRAGLARIDDDFRVNIRADLDLGAASRDLAAWRAIESRRGTITQEVVIDRDKLGAGLAELGSGVGSAARLAAQFAVASSQAVFLANTAATVGPILAKTAGLGALIPAAIAPAVGVVGTIKLGADGITKAFEGSQDSAKHLRDEVSRTFERGLQPSVRNVNRMLPQLEGGFRGVARELSDVANRSTEAFARPERIAQINSLLGTSARVSGNLGRALAPVAESLLNVAEIGSPAIERMTVGAEGAAQRFRDWTASAEGTKQIEGWIRGGVGAFRELWDVATDVVDIGREVVGIFQEAGIGIDTGFGAGVARIKEFIQTAEGHATVRELADTIKLLSDTVSGVLSYALDTLGPPLQDALHGFQDLVRAVGPHLPAAIDLVGDALTGAGKVMSFVADVLDTLPDGFVDAAVKAGVLYLALRKFGALNIASSLLGGFSVLPGALGNAEKQVSSSGTRAGTGFAAGFKGVISKAGWAALGLTIVEELTRGMFQGRTNNAFARALGLDDDDGAISGTFKLFKTGIQETINALRNPGHTMFDDLIPQMREAAGLGPEVKTSFDGLGVSIDLAKIKADAAAAGVGGAFRAMTEGAWTFSSEGNQAIGSGIGNMTNTIGTGMGGMQAIMAGGWGGLQATVGAGMGGMTQSVGSGLGRMTEYVGTGVNSMRMRASGGLGGMVNDTRAHMNSAVGAVGSGFAGMVGAANAGANGMIGAAGRGVAGVRGAFNDSGWYGVGTNIVGGVSAGIAGAAGGLARQAAQAAKNALAAAKGVLGIASPSRVFRDEVGKMAMVGMAQGIEQNSGLVVTAVQRMSARVADAAVQKTSGLAQAAKEILEAIAIRPQDVFEDFSFRGNSALVSQLNDQLADAFYGSGGVFNAESMTAYLQGVVAQGGAALTATHRIEGNGITAAIERGLSAWNLQIDSQGVLYLTQSASRDNRYGR